MSAGRAGGNIRRRGGASTLSRRAFLTSLAAAVLTAPTASFAQSTTTPRSWRWTGPTGQVVRAPFPFTSIGASWTGSARSLRVRVSSDGATWSAWLPVTTHEQHGRTAADGRRFGDLLVVPPSTYLETGADDHNPAIRLDLIDATAGPSTPTPLARGAQAGVPIIPRAEWGCDERLRFDATGAEIWPAERYVVEKVVVHHTATSDGGTNPILVVRSIYTYHAASLGWGDIGYNYLVDWKGNVYEGRHGGPGVEAGHAYGHNPGSIGIACVGDYSGSSITAAMRTSLARLIAQVAPYLDPHDSGWFVDGEMPNLMGHRDAMQYRPGDGTECPGDALYAVLPGLRGDVRFNLPTAPAPAATILDVGYDRPSFLPGGTMTVTVKLKNTGNVTLSTQGPAGTLTYAESETASGRGYGDRAGAWRVALDLPGGGAAAEYPFRWGFAQPLEPGQIATITGRITLNGPGKRTAAIGLVRESRYWSLRAVSPTTITVIDPTTLRRRQTVPSLARRGS